MLSLKERIFETPEFCLEEILESLERQEKVAIFQPEEKKPVEILNEEVLVVESEKKPDIILYELNDDTYYVFKAGYEDKTTSYGVFIPTGVTVRRVPQHVLETGVLGRAFINSNYIEILDSLVGSEYNEVLTHEVLHIMHPEKKELEIRQMTRNYLGNTVYN